MPVDRREGNDDHPDILRNFLIVPAFSLFLVFFSSDSSPIRADVIAGTYDLFTLPAKKWHWRARCSALHFADAIPLQHDYQLIWTSSVLNLAELLGMRSDLASCKKIVYFHENQLVYPVQAVKQRDCQYGLNQIMTW